MTFTIVNHLKQEYESWKTLFENQPAIIQHFFDLQAQATATALISKTAPVKFALPDQILGQDTQTGQNTSIAVPEAERQYTVGGFLRNDTAEALSRRFNELEKSPDQAIALSAGLLRYATVTHMIHDLLPAGRMVKYCPNGDEEIPTIPVEDHAPESAITQASDAIVEEGNKEKRGDLQTPFVPAARKFFLPQWVAFDDKGKLLVGSAKEAEAHVQSMQRYAMILHRALALAPYMSASEEYQRKRYGILGQLINQGRALADFKTQEIISKIKERAEKQSLNRGLSVTLPYFDDQDLEMNKTDFEVIPAGRIMFIPAFVVRATRGEQVKVAQDTRLNVSTRNHLLTQLKNLEIAFES